MLGQAAPNRINAGSPNVAVGTPIPGALGGAVGPAGTFCTDYCALKKDWPNLSPTEREARYKQLMAGLFQKFGAPAPIITTATKPGSDGSWDQQAWAVNLPPGAWEAKSPPPVETTVHEARHAEQTFAAVRKMTTENLSGDTKVPQHVEDAASTQPLDRSSAEGRWAQVMHAEQYTPDGREAMNEIIAEIYRTAKNGDKAGYRKAAEAYEKRPVGQDAAELEQACKCAC